MFWIIVFIAAIIAIIIVAIIHREPSYLIFIFVVVTASLVVHGLAHIREPNKKPFKTIENSINIVSAYNDEETDGRFFLGSGRIDEEEYIFTFAGSKDSGYKRLKIRMDELVIIEDNTKEPQLLLTERYYKGFLIFGYSNFEDRILYVPEGTIIKDFELR